MKQAAAVLALMLLSACAHGGTPSVAPAAAVPARRVDAAGFAAFQCAAVTASPQSGEASLHARGAMLKLAEPVDYVALRGLWWPVPASEGVEARAARVVTYAKAGARCPDDVSTVCEDVATAQELTAVAEVVHAPGALAGARVLYFLIRQGPGVRAIVAPAEQRALLGPVDSEAEAWFWLMQSAPYAAFECDALERSAHRAVADGYELRIHTATSSCRPLTEAIVTYHVARDGTVRELSRSVVRDEPEGCIVS
jgi:hypothetical protein